MSNYAIAIGSLLVLGIIIFLAEKVGIELDFYNILIITIYIRLIIIDDKLK